MVIGLTQSNQYSRTPHRYSHTHTGVSLRGGTLHLMVYLHLHKHSATFWLICKDKKRPGNFKSYNFMVNKSSQNAFFISDKARRPDSHIKHARLLVVSHTDSSIPTGQKLITLQAISLKCIFFLCELPLNIFHHTSSLHEF